MKILAIEHELPNVAAEDFRRYANEEARKAWDLHQAGLIRELYFRSDRNEVSTGAGMWLHRGSRTNLAGAAICPGGIDRL